VRNALVAYTHYGLQTVPSSLVLLAGAFGAAAGAFVPRVVDRLAVPSGSPPRSACAACARPFPSGLDGWVRAGAACPCSSLPWATVASSAAAAGMLGAAMGARAVLPVLLLAVVLGVVLALIDARCRRLPDPVVGVLAVSVGVPLIVGAVVVGEPGRVGRGMLAAALVGLAYLAVALLPGNGLGLGDVKLAAVLAFVLGFLGWPAVAVGTVAPHLINGPVVVALLLSGRLRRRSAVPFGPALLVGALIGIATTA
jgi:leader peptidase (prepilin peptidase)/N-methyltransferase